MIPVFVAASRVSHQRGPLTYDGSGCLIGFLLVSKENGHAVTFKITGRYVGLAISVNVADGESPRALPRGKRRARRRIETAPTVAEHDAHATARRGDRADLGLPGSLLGLPTTG